MIRAVALGYDLACRLLMALRPDLVRGSNRSAEGTVSTFGSLGAAASLARLEEVRMRYALPYSLFYPLPAGELNDAIRINCCLLANFLNLLTETSLAFCPSSGLCMLRFQFSSRWSPPGLLRWPGWRLHHIRSAPYRAVFRRKTNKGRLVSALLYTSTATVTKPLAVSGGRPKKGDRHFTTHTRQSIVREAAVHFPSHAPSAVWLIGTTDIMRRR
jgi:hypothetical protein